MKPTRNHLFAACIAFAGSICAASGQSNWTSTAGGSWNTATNWSTNPTIPNSSTAIVNFSQDFTGSPIITLDNASGFSINQITYNDTGATGDSTLSINSGTGGALTLAGTSPVIDVSALNPNTSRLTINTEIAGTAGLNMTGSGTGGLRLNGANTYSGTTTLSRSNDNLLLEVGNNSALGSSNVLVVGRQQFGLGISVLGGFTISNALELRRGASGSGRAVLGLAPGATWAGNITLDNTTALGYASITSISGTVVAPAVVSGNIGFSALGAANTDAVVLRGAAGKVTGQVSLSTGRVTLLDGSSWEFSNASNTWGSLNISNNAAVVTVGATNTLSPTGVVETASTTGTLRLNNQAATTAYSQSIAGLSGTVAVGLATGTATLTLNTTSNQAHTGVISGALSLVKSGSARQTLSGNNSYTGTTTVTGGTLALGSANAIGTIGSLNMNGGTLQFSAANTTDYTTTARLKLEDAATSKFDTNAQNVTFGSPILLGVLGNGGLEKNGPGTLSLAGDQSYQGETVVSAGTLVLNYSTANGSKLSDTGTLTLGGMTLTLSGGSHPEVVGATVVSGASTINRTSGAATIQLGNITRTDSNTLDIASDAIARTSLSNDINGKLPLWITVNGQPAANDGSGNIVTFGGFINVPRLGGLIASNPFNNVQIVNGGTSGPITPSASGLTEVASISQTASDGPAVISLTGSDTLRLGAVGAIVIPSFANSLSLQGGVITAGGATDSNGVIAVNADSDLTISSLVANNGSGTVSLSKTGSGSLTLSEANDLTGGITLNNGQLRINNSLALGLGNLVINGGGIDNTSGAAISISDTIPQIWNSNVNFAGTNELLFGSGTVTMTANQTITVANDILGIGGSLNGAFTLTKTGAGTLLLASGTWTGLTTVSMGTLRVGSKAPDVPYVVASGATLRIGYSTGGGYAATNLKLTGDGISATTGLYLQGGTSYNTSGTMELLAAPTTIRQEGFGAANLSIFDVNSVGLLVTASASGSQTDANVNFVNGGFGMSIQTDSGVNTATGDFILNGSLNVDSNSGLVKRGVGSLRLNGTATTNHKNLRLLAGSVLCGVQDCLGLNSRLDLAANTKLVLNGFNQATSSLLANSGRIVGGSPTSSTLTINQVADAIFSGTLGGVGTNENNFALTKSGSSTLTLSAINSYTGDTTVNAGVLSLGSAFLADGSDVRLATGAVLDLTTGVTDVIDEFVVNGAAQPVGVYGALGSGAQFERAYLTGTGTLTVTTGGAGGYDSWVASFTWPSGADTTRTGDPDGDGFSNLQEFLFGTSPVAGNGSLSTSTTSGGILTIRWSQRVTGSTYSLIESATLVAPWNLSSATPVDDGAAVGDYQPRKADITLGVGSLFFRVQGVEN